MTAEAPTEQLQDENPLFWPIQVGAMTLNHRYPVVTSTIMLSVQYRMNVSWSLVSKLGGIQIIIEYNFMARIDQSVIIIFLSSFSNFWVIWGLLSV